MKQQPLGGAGGGAAALAPPEPSMPRRRPTPAWRRWGQRALAHVAGAAGRAAGRLSPDAGAWLGAALGTLAFWTLSGRRRVALDNLALAFGTVLSTLERRAIARATFQHLGVTVVECCRLFLGSPEAVLARVRLEGVEHVKAALAEGRGTLFLTAHFGNFELLAAAHALAGLAPLNVVVRPLDNPYLDALVARGRERAQISLITKRAAFRDMRAALGRGECVAILLDQNDGRHGVFVPFFGRLASTSRSLAVLALKTGAPVVPAFIRRLPDGEHQVTLKPAIPVVRTGQVDRDVELNTARFTEVIECQVRAAPQQWFWVHRRWKSQPS